MQLSDATTNTLMEDGDEKEPREAGEGFILSVALVGLILQRFLRTSAG